MLIFLLAELELLRLCNYAIAAASAAYRVFARGDVCMPSLMLLLPYPCDLSLSSRAHRTAPLAPKELRRGMDRAEVSSICFNQQSTFVACCSDRGTVHIFSLEPGTSNGPGAGGGGGHGEGGHSSGGMGGGGGVAPDESPRMGGARRSMTTGATRNAMSG